MTFVPPVAPKIPLDTAPWFQTELLLHCDGTNGSTTITDSSHWQRSLSCVGGASLTTADKEFGNASLNVPWVSFSPCGVSFSNTAGQIAFLDKDFTIECFFKLNALHGGGNWQWFIVFNDGGDGQGPALYIEQGNYINFLFAPYGSSGWAGGVGSDGNAPTGVWTHLAVTRQGTALKMFVGGVQQTAVGTFPAGYSIRTSGTGYVGYNMTVGGGRSFDGKIDEMIITVGKAKYTGSFTPPIAPLGGPPNAMQGEMRQDLNSNVWQCSNIATQTWNKVPWTEYKGLP